MALLRLTISMRTCVSSAGALLSLWVQVVGDALAVQRQLTRTVNSVVNSIDAGAKRESMPRVL